MTNYGFPFKINVLLCLYNVWNGYFDKSISHWQKDWLELYSLTVREWVRKVKFVTLAALSHGGNHVSIKKSENDTWYS